MTAGRRLVAVAVALGAVVLLAACGSHKTTRSRVDDYIKRTNAIQQRSAFAFTRANTAYRSFASGSLRPTDVDKALGGAEVVMRRTRVRLAAVPAPADASTLRALLLRLFDVDAELAHETTVLARYQPAATAVLKPLTKINLRLRSDLRAGRAAPAQARALARYAASLTAVARRLRRLTPPPVLVPTHKVELKRLEDTASLGQRLRGAIVRKDAKTVARLLLRFRNVGSSNDAQGLAARAARAYGRRYDFVGRVQAALQHERLRLDKALK